MFTAVLILITLFCLMKGCSNEQRLTNFQRRNSDEIKTVNDLTNNPTSVVPVEQQFGLSRKFNDEQQQALRYKMLQSCVDLKIDAIEAQNQNGYKFGRNESNHSNCQLFEPDKG